MIKSLLLSVFLIFTVASYGQSKTITGFTKDKETGQEIAYVNIGVLNKNTGTVSNINGKFELTIDDQFDNETLRISIVGYKSLTYKVSDFKKAISESNSILLERNIAELKEIVIKNKNLKSAEIGNILDRRTVSAGFVNNVLGNEIGIVVKVKGKPTYVESFNAIVDYNHYGELKFRLNLYDLKNGIPNNSILTESIIITSKIEKGKLTVDLSDYNIMVNGNFFVSLELIEGLGEGGLHFLADYDGPKVLTRAVSQGKWNEVDKLSFGFSVNVKY